MFTDYATLVYDLLSYTEGKTSVDIMKEIDAAWVKEHKRGWFGKPKTCSLGAVYAALAQLEREGCVQKVFQVPSGEVRGRFYWTKKQASRKAKNRPSFLSRLFLPITT